jgi:sigma-B regulation protein RsbU (phosphoserine phosphatase)
VVSVCTILIFSVAISYFYHRSRVALEREVENNAEKLVLASVNRMEATLRAIGKVAEAWGAPWRQGDLRPVIVAPSAADPDRET